MLRIRPYNIKDAETILSWTKDEKAFYKWTAGVLGTYPLSVEQFIMMTKRLLRLLPRYDLWMIA